MLDLKFIRQNPEIVRKAIGDKRVNLNLDELLIADSKVLEMKREIQGLEERKNANAKAIPKATPEERKGLIELGRSIGDEIAKLKPSLEAAESNLNELLALSPCIPSPLAPVGKSEEENVEIRKWGTIPDFEFPIRDHVQLLDLNGWAELDRVAKVSGSRTYCLKGELVMIENALMNFALKHLAAKGFTPLTVPALARESALFGTGHFPVGRDQVYHLAADDLYLSGTAEVVINSLHADEILQESDLPILYAGISPCFRREAGSAGRDVRGLVRVHQFTKVEQFIICKNDPEESERWHQFLLRTSEEIVQTLGVPYRVIEVCTGDMGVGKYRMFDIESWVPSEGKYRETHSCSNLHEWQARRTGLRYRDQNGKVQYCHTLNNTALATPRFLVPLMENNQTKEGKISWPQSILKMS